ncbi:MAG: DUF4157 domain-containing protein [Deltaproteobacteria bacterium]|nr:DUF4157 domain-containing protein [Deltaproteobacteria bacterium]
MANMRDDELLELQAQAAELAAAKGADPGVLASQLAGAQTAQMGKTLTDRYASMGARWLSDQVPTKLDPVLIDRLSRMGFRSERLDQVRIHRGPKAQQAAGALSARAFAVGESDIFFGQGEFDPNTRGGLAVLAHELAHVAPPDAGVGAGGGVAPGLGGGMPSSFQGPVLNERKRGDEDAAGAEAHEKQAREAERRVFAQEDGGGSPAMSAAPSSPAAPVKTDQDAKDERKLDPAMLEAKVLQLISKWERQECERSGVQPG